MTHFSLGHLKTVIRVSAVAGAIALGCERAPLGASAEPFACPAASPVAGTPGASLAPTVAPEDSTPTQAVVPTQAAVEQEVNPPGDIPDDLAFITYSSSEGGYSIQVPEGWSRTETGANV